MWRCARGGFRPVESEFAVKTLPMRSIRAEKMDPKIPQIKLFNPFAGLSIFSQTSLDGGFQTKAGEQTKI